MVPFDGSAPSQQQQGVSQAPLPRPPMPPGAPSPGMHQQPMNAPYGHGMHRQGPPAMSGGQPYQIPPQSPSPRHSSFSMANAGPQGQYSSHPPMHSPAHQQQPPGMHPSMPPMHRSSTQSRSMSSSHMGMPMQPQHEQMMSTSQGRSQSYMGNSMGPSLNSSMNNPMNMVGPMNNSITGPMGNSMNNSMNNNMGGSMSSSMNNTMANSMSGSMGNSMSSSGPPSGLNGNWQTDRDTPHRREMIQHIVKMLKKDKNGSPEWLSKLPQMAKQLEVSLYRNARSFEAYMDMSTLKQRLQQIAVEVSRKARTQGDQRDDRQRDRQLQQQSSTSMRPDSTSASSFIGVSASSQHQQMAAPRSQPMNSSDINQMSTTSASGVNIGGSMPSMGANAYQNSRPINGANLNRTSGPSTAPNAVSVGQPGKGDPEWKIRIRHKQQRLLLLHHSAKCPHEDGRCSVTPHCADMKRLWKHMEGCKDNQCRVAHCFSSRAILSHYRKCKDPACPACGPVRETVRRSQSRPANMSVRSPNSGGAVGLGVLPGSNRMVPGSSHSQQNAVSQNDMGTSRGGNFQAPTIGQPFLNPQTQTQPPMPPPNGSAGSNSTMQFSSLQPSVQQQPNPQPQFRSIQPSAQSSNGSYHGSDNHGTSDGTIEMSTVGTGGSNQGPPGRRNDSEWQKVRHKQQRLLLLRHASRCQYSGKCPVTPHCASMKKLWEHIAHCKDQQCSVPHCMSSRYVLSHYRRCKDARCPACAPVRETIRKSNEKERGRPQSLLDSNAFDAESVHDVDSLSPGMDATGPGGVDSSASPDYAPAMKRTKVDQPQSVPVVELSQPNADQPAITTGGAPVSSSTNIQTKPVTESTAPGSSDSTKAVPSLTQSHASQTKGSDDRSLLNGFTVDELTTHLASLNRASQLPPAKLKQKCSEVLKTLQTHQHGWVFNCPVDPVELGLPDYFEIIKKPMDLGTIHKKLDAGAYHTIEEFQADVNLTFDNAMTYNERGTVVYDMAKELKVKFESDYKKLVEQLDAEDQERRQNDRACVLCGCEKRLFEPPVFFCNGMNCSSKRIRRNSHFYIGGNNQYFWCNQCFNELDDKSPIELIDITIQKSDLMKKKNDEVHEESWVQCDVCNRWIHQICGLFNTRQNKEHHSEYCCPLCLLEKRKTTETTPPPKPPGAADLPRTKLSEYLENHVACRIEAKRRHMAQDKATAENTSFEDALKIMNECGPVIIRQVTSMDRKLEVRERMLKRYAHKNYPEEFPFRCKCILVFQQIDGVDVVLFALYVYEHGADSPPPNQRCVYISYLDSVHFMRPRRMRTFVYHEILIGYLDYARRRGFATAHIWACPPLKGDDYIFYAKPEDQKTPRDSRLRQWYIDMLVDCQNRDVVGKVTNMYDLYFSNEALDATAVPYLEGDYFPGEAENIIKMLEEGGGKKGGTSGKKNKKKNQNKAKSRGGTRSTGVDEEALIASGMMDGIKNFEELDRDQVMVKLGETIQPMKESFIVAFLNWESARKEDMEVPDSVLKFREEHPEAIIPLRSGTKRDADGNIRDDAEMFDKNGRPMKVIDDDAEDLDCEFLNNRQAFLNLCRGNHYQFDELRRAKHTSMMVLWHLHNRDAPKFVQQCFACNREILSGKRYHCNTCPDYDLCEQCFKDPKTNRGSCNHTLQPIAVESENGQDGQSSSSGLTEAQRQQRQRNLMLHIQLIEHASRCSSSSCASSNCAKMKNYLQHARTCKTKVQGGCRICKRIWTLLRIHAQKCKDTVCPIPQCMVIREKMRELQKQQQAMDDRRRLEMNRHYRMGVTSSAAS